MVTRTDVLVRLGQGNGDLAKKYYYLGLICKAHISVLLIITFGYFKDSIIPLFTSVAPVYSYLEYIFPLFLLLQVVNPFYATTSTILRISNKSEYLAIINFVSMTGVMDLSAGLVLFCTDWNPAYFFIGPSLGRLVGTVWSFTYILGLDWKSLARA